MRNRPPITPEQLLALLADAIRTAPNFDDNISATESHMKWIAKSKSIVDLVEDIRISGNFHAACKSFGTILFSKQSIMQPMYDAYAYIELRVPSSTQGAFIPPGETWNGYAAIMRIIQKPCDDLLIVDPYLNAEFFTSFAPHSKARNSTRGLTNRRDAYHNALVATEAKWSADSVSNEIEIDLRYAPNKSLHDRLIIIDTGEVWLVSQSLKDIAKNSPASVTRADVDIAQMKADHYNELWKNSQPFMDI